MISVKRLIRVSLPRYRSVRDIVHPVPLPIRSLLTDGATVTRAGMEQRPMTLWAKRCAPPLSRFEIGLAARHADDPIASTIAFSRETERPAGIAINAGGRLTKVISSLLPFR